MPKIVQLLPPPARPVRSNKHVGAFGVQRLERVSQLHICGQRFYGPLHPSIEHENQRFVHMAARC